MENMIYNSQTEKLKIPEYGRHVQNLINYVKTVEDPEKRQNIANAIVDLMYRMNPQNKNVIEFKDKLWGHFFRIAEYDIDVKNPGGETISEAPEELDKESNLPTYPENSKSFRHYGSNVKTMISKALEMEEGPIRDEFLRSIGSYMKLAYKTWNREHYVSDDIIKEDLISMTDGKVNLDADVSLDIFKSSMPSSNYQSHKRKRGKGSGSSGRNRSNKSRRR